MTRRKILLAGSQNCWHSRKIITAFYVKNNPHRPCVSSRNPSRMKLERINVGRGTRRGRRVRDGNSRTRDRRHSQLPVSWQVSQLCTAVRVTQVANVAGYILVALLLCPLAYHSGRECKDRLDSIYMPSWSLHFHSEWYIVSQQMLPLGVLSPCQSLRD